MIDLYTEFKTALQALEAAEVPYAVCGGLALMVYQLPRATVDIDLVLPADATDACAAVLVPLGYRPHPRRMRFASSGVQILRFYKVEPGGPDALTLDCLLTTHPTILETWRSRVRVPFEDRTIWVVSLEGLIALKQLRGSPLDLLDIQALRESGPRTHPGEDDA